MSACVELRRTVNVGATNRIPTPELRRALETEGLERVSTVLQSRCVAFVAREQRVTIARVRSPIAGAASLEGGVLVPRAAEIAGPTRTDSGSTPVMRNVPVRR